MRASSEDLKRFLEGHRKANALLPWRFPTREVPGGSEADLSLWLPGYEEHLMARAVLYDLGHGRQVRLCSAEDLVIHKALAGRPQDLLDIEGIVARQGDKLDVGYLRQWLARLSRVSADPEGLAPFGGRAGR